MLMCTAEETSKGGGGGLQNSACCTGFRQDYEGFTFISPEIQTAWLLWLLFSMSSTSCATVIFLFCAVKVCQLNKEAGEISFDNTFKTNIQL